MLKMQKIIVANLQKAVARSTLLTFLYFLAFLIP